MVGVRPAGMPDAIGADVATDMSRLRGTERQYRENGQIKSRLNARHTFESPLPTRHSAYRNRFSHVDMLLTLDQAVAPTW